MTIDARELAPLNDTLQQGLNKARLVGLTSHRDDGGSYLFAAWSDGTVYMLSENRTWEEFPAVPRLEQQD